VQSKPLRRSDKASMSSIRYDLEEDQVSFALVMKVRDPNSYKETIEVDGSDKWAIAMEQEMKSLERNQT